MTTTPISFLRMLCLVGLGLLFVGNLYADDYKEFSQQLRQQIWESSRPEFQRYDIPEQYKNESAVILALYEEVVATGKSKFRYDPNSLFAMNKELNYSNTYRRMIYINDKTALEKNAEISYVEQQKSMGFRVSAKSKLVIGVRIIKPGGQITEVDMDEAVSVTEGKKDKESHKQLAIPNLQVGDVLDYFIYNEGRVDYLNIPPRNFYLCSSYPILSYSIHCEVDRKLTTEYRSVNGAPDFATHTDADGDIILDITKTDIPKMDASNWTSSLRQYPTARLAIYFNSNKKIFKPGSHRERGLHKNVAPEVILHDAMGYFAGRGFYLIIGTTKKKAKKHFKRNPGMDNMAKAEYLNTALWYDVRTFDLSPGTYMHSLHKLLTMFKIEHKVGFVTDRFDARYTEVSNHSDFYPVIVANNGKQFLLPPYEAFNMGYTPANEGEMVQTVGVKKMSSQSKEGIKGTYGQIMFPLSQPADNVNKTVQRVEFSAENPLTLTIGKEEHYTGKTRNSRYPNQILYREKLDAIARYLDRPTVLEDLQKYNRQRDVDAYNASVAKNVKDRDAAIKELLAEEYEAQVKDVIEYTYPKLGVTPNEKEAVFHVRFTADGLVKRAGNNYILDVGKLIGSQVVISPEDRNRSIDAYLPGVRTLRNEITLTIPSGYTVQGVEKLNGEVDNEYGQFLSSASIQGDKVTITALKVYKQNNIPVSGWATYVQMLDAANDFYAQTIVLRKMKGEAPE